MTKVNSMCFTGAATLHVPAHSGVALKKECAAFAQAASPFVCPFLAVEQRGGFRGYWWKPWSRLSSGPTMAWEQGGWRVT